AAEDGHDPLHDAEAEPDATRTARAARPHLMERLEDVREVARRHAGARVGDGDREPSVARPGRGLHDDAARLRELDRVVDEVPEHLMDLDAVGLEDRTLGCDVRLEQHAGTRASRLQREDVRDEWT